MLDGLSFLPIEGHWKVVLSLNADVRIPLVQGLHVLLKHPLIPSGNTVGTEPQVSELVVRRMTKAGSSLIVKRSIPVSNVFGG